MGIVITGDGLSIRELATASDHGLPCARLLPPGF
jgi:hypothetical protein